jgi:hypothetical protein
VLPVPAIVSVLAPLEMLPVILSKLLELLVHVWAAPKAISELIVSAPPLIAIPLAPSVSVFVPLPDAMNTVPGLEKLRPKADWLALRFTPCAPVTVMMLKKATSEEPGGSAGLGIGELLAVDQELAEFHPRVDVPVPSQKMFVAGARAGDKAQVKNAP